MAEAFGQTRLQGVVFRVRFGLDLIEPKKLLVRRETVDAVGSGRGLSALVEIVKIEQMISSIAHIPDVHQPAIPRRPLHIQVIRQSVGGGHVR